MLPIVCKMLERGEVGGGCCINWAWPASAQHTSHVAKDIHIVLTYSAGIQRHLGIVYHVSGPVTVTLLRNWILQSGNMWLVGKATSSEQGHFQAERARLCQLGYSPHKILFVCVLFWVLRHIRPPWALRGECSQHKSGSGCPPLSVCPGCEAKLGLLSVGIPGPGDAGIIYIPPPTFRAGAGKACSPECFWLFYVCLQVVGEIGERVCSSCAPSWDVINFHLKIRRVAF